MWNKMELLAPAGDLEKLKTAVDYGADAVYFGGEAFSLRAGADNFSPDEMKEGIAYAHEKGKKCYLTLNIFPHNEDLPLLEDFVEEIKDHGLDAFILSDPGAISILRHIIPEAEIHLSTQANVTNYRAAEFWYEQGIRRIVLAREMSLEDIRNMREKIPADLEIEAFVHGAMCISYSGRCLLSNFMVDRDANRGQCAHPCRWKYALVEEKRPGEYYPVEEDDRGTYIMNSGDLCMIRHMGALAKAGVNSAKIEGRMKSVFYVATVVGAYRRAIDAFYRGEDFKEEWMEEVSKVSHRNFTTGFYFRKPTCRDQDYLSSAYQREYSFVGIVREYHEDTAMAVVEQRNKMSLGEEIEIFGPDKDFFTQKLQVLLDDQGNPIQSAPHPQQIVKIKMDLPVEPGDILRKKKEV
ncbi:MAG: peptidase U32 family protein [Anaerovoracaceae bacterium]|jgi:putative protease